MSHQAGTGAIKNNYTGMLESSVILGKNILVLTAHPDDESFLAAGTIYANSQAGGKAFLVCATLGEKGQSHLEEPMDEQHLKQVRRHELEQAAQIVGVNNLKILDFPDGQVEENKQAILSEVEKLWEEINPEVIVSFGPDGITGHKDHIAISDVAKKLAEKHKATLAMCTIAKDVADVASEWLKSRRKTIGHYSEDECKMQPENLTISINTEIKLKAVRCHKSQVPEENPFGSFPQNLGEALLKQESFTL